VRAPVRGCGLGADLRQPRRGPDINAQLWRRLIAAGAKTAFFDETERIAVESLVSPSRGKKGRLQNEPNSGIFGRSRAGVSRGSKTPLDTGPRGLRESPEQAKSQHRLITVTLDEWRT
jgi:hypothetical protein